MSIIINTTDTALVSGRVGAFADVPFATYQAAAGINKSGLDVLRDNPRRFHLESTGQVERKPPTAAMLAGTLLHEQVMFGTATYYTKPDTYGDGKPWNGNAGECKAWLAAHTDRPVLKQSEVDQLRWEADAVLENKDAAELLKTADGREVSCFARSGHHRGLLLKARLDLLGADWFADLKTCADASTATLSREILNRRYHVQFAHYRRVLQLLGLDEPKAYIIALEKGDLPRCQVREIAKQALDLGDAQLDADLQLYRQCRLHDYWPDFADEEKDATGIKAIDLPEYVYGKTDLLGGLTPANVA